MNVKRLLFPLLLATTKLTAEISEEFVVNLKSPQYSDGVVSTDQGGLITAPSLRIQARNIRYIHKAKGTEPVQRVEAEGDLMMSYEGQIFTGEKLYFDLLTKTGCLWKGRTAVGIWFLGGDILELCDDQTVLGEGIYATTWESDANVWEVRTRKAALTEHKYLDARDVSFRVAGIPIFWIPGYKTNLKDNSDTPLRYWARWDAGLGPKISMRYRFYSSETWGAYARIDYRFSRGAGGALEADYQSTDGRTQFQTRNYGALDKIFQFENGDVRYRFQGLFKTKSKDKMSRLHIQWDKLSDKKMVGDFRNSDFEINTKKATYFEGVHYDEHAFGSLTVRPQINNFQSLNQELPYGAFGIRPFEIGRTGVISENYATAAYYDYVYAKVLDKTPTNQSSGRIETINTLYRPISLGGLTVTPRGGIVGIYYSDSPQNDPVGQFAFTYGGDANVTFSRSFEGFKHMVEPYAQHLGYTKPKARVDDYFIFDIHDGYDQLDQLRFGVRQQFYSRSSPVILPTFRLDLYGYSFWGAQAFDQRIPKLFADFEINRSSYAIDGGLAWNLEKKLLDYGNARLLYTVNDRFAFGVEYRHRSKFWWRKAIQDNFVVDFARPLSLLVETPLSDRRDTFLTRTHWRLSPRWQLNLQTFHGWHRKDERSYNGAKIDIYTMLSGSWQMKFSYKYIPGSEFSFKQEFKIVK